MEAQDQISDSAPHIGDLSSISCALADSLESAIMSPEWRFLMLGHRLQSINSQAEQLAQSAIETNGLISENSGKSFLGNAERAARRCLVELNRYQIKLSNSLDAMCVGANHLLSLHDRCSSIKKISKGLNIVSLNIAMETCRLGESEEIFEDFILESRSLAERLNLLTRQIQEDSKIASTVLFASNHNLSKDRIEFVRVYDSAEKTVQHAVQEAIRLTNLSTRALKTAAADSKVISGQVGIIVEGLQFHDIAKQKVNHIATALRGLAHMRNDEISSSEEKDGAGRLSRAYSVFTIQLAQLAQVIVDVERIHQRCEKAFEEILKKVESLADSFQASRLSGKNQGQIDVQLTAIGSGLESLLALYDHGCNLDGQIQQTAEKMFKTVSNLSKHIYHMKNTSSTEIHRKALNVIVETERLDEKGQAIAVIAKEVRKISEESRKYNIEIVDILESISGISTDMKGWVTLKEGQFSHGEQVPIDESLKAEIKNISHGYQNFRQAAAVSSTQAAIMQTEISQANADLNFLSDLSGFLRYHLGIIYRLLQSMEPWVDRGSMATTPEIENMIQNYTTKQERVIHRLVINSAEKPHELFKNDLYHQR